MVERQLGHRVWSPATYSTSGVRRFELCGEELHLAATGNQHTASGRWDECTSRRTSSRWTSWARAWRACAWRAAAPGSCSRRRPHHSSALSSLMSSSGWPADDPDHPRSPTGTATASTWAPLRVPDGLEQVVERASATRPAAPRASRAWPRRFSRQHREGVVQLCHLVGGYRGPHYLPQPCPSSTKYPRQAHDQVTSTWPSGCCCPETRGWRLPWRRRCSDAGGDGGSPRGLWGCAGIAPDGEPLTVQATGMGSPSAAIVCEDRGRSAGPQLDPILEPAGAGSTKVSGLGTLLSPIESALRQDGRRGAPPSHTTPRSHTTPAPTSRAARENRARGRPP